MFTADQGKLISNECALALSGVLKKVNERSPDLHAQFVMSNCKIALRYLQHIHQIGTATYPPIAVSLCRTFYEIVCATMYLAANKGELGDFLKFGRLLYYEMGEAQNLKGKLLRQLVPDHEELRTYFRAKKDSCGGKQKQLSWHGMSIVELGLAVGMEQYADDESDVKSRRSHYTRTSKFVHGDSLISLLAYNFDENGIEPTPFAPPMEIVGVDALSLTCGWFIVLIASVGVGLSIDVATEYHRLNGVWRRVWEEATGTKITTPLDALVAESGTS
jgi:Family of unknown function (DUF5677)